LNRRVTDLATARDLLRETIAATESAATPEQSRLRLSEEAPPPTSGGGSVRSTVGLQAGSDT
jgi:hypothetical protein